MKTNEEMKVYEKPEATVFELEGQPMMLDTSEIGFGEGGGDANGMRNPFKNPFANPFGGNPFANPFGL